MSENADGADGEAPVEVERGPSRSAGKRHARAVTDLGARLIACPKQELAHLPLSDDVRRAIEVARGIGSRGAGKRQLLYLGKLLRGEDTEAIEAALSGAGPSARDELTAELEEWRARIVEEGDLAVDAFVEAFPGADRPRLRQLARTARLEGQSEVQARRAAKRLFAALREGASGAPAPPTD